MENHIIDKEYEVYLEKLIDNQNKNLDFLYKKTFDDINFKANYNYKDFNYLNNFLKVEEFENYSFKNQNYIGYLLNQKENLIIKEKKIIFKKKTNIKNNILEKFYCKYKYKWNKKLIIEIKEKTNLSMSTIYRWNLKKIQEKK